jgi:uncharacterized protein (TIGR02147 family)
MSIYDFEDYKVYVLDVLKKMPQQGYGQFRKMAEHLQVNSVIISQVFKGDRDLSAEQALELCQYLGLSELETEYFVLLVQKARASTPKLRTHLKNKLQALQEKASDLKTRLPQDKALTEEAKALFYSNWYYSGIRLLTSIKGFNDVDSIAIAMHLPRATVKHVTEFLVAHGLCLEEKGKLSIGPRLTHLESSSPLVSRHHTNWRLRGLANQEPLSKDELMYSGPMSLSQKDMEWVRSRIVELIEDVVHRVKDSDSEKLACLNIDWFDFRKRP